MTIRIRSVGITNQYGGGSTEVNLMFDEAQEEASVSVHKTTKQ